jgi:O-antigen ligase
VLLIAYNLGGAFSLMPVAEEKSAIWFVVISFYMATMGIFIAALVTEDTVRRLRAMRSGVIVAGVIAATAGIVGYFDIAGSGEYLTLYGRASGTFKDPNVLGTFLTLPCVFLVQGFLSGRQRRPVLASLALLIVLAGVFLSFSRGAWGVTLAAIIMMVALTYVTTGSGRMRARIVLLTLAGMLAFAALLTVALQFESVRDTFSERASLDQSYDQGEQGRFGNQRRSIPMLLERPNGFGPLMFREFFPEDPHNTYINAFAAYGWLGGVSYFALIAATRWVGWRLVFQRTAWQGEAIAVWSAFFFLILQGLQIDTDHWRHWYLLLGFTWGLAAVSQRHVNSGGGDN